MTRQFLAIVMSAAFLCSLNLTVAANNIQTNTDSRIVVSNSPHKPGSTAADKVTLSTSAPAKSKAAPAKKTQSTKAAKSKSSAKKSSEKITAVQQSNWRLKVAQQKLQVLGFSSEKPSGKMTAATTDALKRFQKQHSLNAHGELDDKTYRKLTWEAFNKEGIKNVQGKDVVGKAAKYKGVPYVFGGTTPKGFDCSGYVQYVFKDCKANLPRTADQQALKGVFVTQKQLKAGDLVFFTTYAAGASHVGIYAGSGQFWSASSSKGVILSSLKDEYWKNRYYGARRVLVANGEA